jgi:hypothetical protein
MICRKKKEERYEWKKILPSKCNVFHFFILVSLS